MRIAHKRIVVRDWTLDDVDASLAIYGDPEVTKYLGGPPREETREEQAARIERIRARAESDPYFAYWAVEREGDATPIGTGLCLKTKHSSGFEDMEDEYEIGWHLGREFWGQGYGTEVAEVMLQVGLEWHPKVIAVAFEPNIASLKIMQKIGMTYEGPTDRFFDIPGLVCYTASRT
ncbi:MAG: GNAT family N-acetyltransferase [Armatimonadetes bacterium]|nr:GNAT family N-acetyltransferase [Armatimonadota bacterium]